MERTRHDRHGGPRCAAAASRSIQCREPSKTYFIKGRICAEASLAFMAAYKKFMEIGSGCDREKAFPTHRIFEVAICCHA
jgi:hypothetical protein